MGKFLGAHSVGALLAAVPKARFLVDGSAAFHNLNLPVDFIRQRLLQEAEGIQVLHFGLDPELRGARQRAR